MKTNRFFFLTLLWGCIFLPQLTHAQEDLDNVDVLFHWQDSDIIGSWAYNNAYNEVWGMVKDGREYAIIGSTEGTHIFDVTFNELIFPVAFIEGELVGGEVVHRDYHDYKDHLYIVCDEGLGTSKLKIVDLSALPNGDPEVVYNSSELFSTAHNIFIDTATAKLYVCIPTENNQNRSSLEVYDISEPANPTLMHEVDLDDWVHDAYVRNDTAYLNVSWLGGVVVMDFSGNAPVTLGSITDYSQFGQGYNHSGWLSEDGKHYVFSDETHGVDMKIVDVTDFTDMQILGTIGSGETDNSIAHNQIIMGDYLFVSYYYDGLQIFDISDPTNVVKVRQFDTYPQENDSGFEGAWGVYPFLPSGKILLSDMQTGLYIFDVNLGLGEEVVGVEPINHATTTSGIQVFPTMIDQNENLTVQWEQSKTDAVDICLFDLTGQCLQRTTMTTNAGIQQHQVTLGENIPNGVLLLQVNTKTGSFTQKIVKQ